MAESTQQDTDRLQQALAILRGPAQPMTPRGRELLGNGEQDALAALLAEADRTLLRRTLRFTNDRSEVLRVEAAERRILRLAQDPQSDITVARDDPDALDTARALLRRFCDGTTSIAVLTALQPNSQDPGVMGVPASLLSTPLTKGADPFAVLPPDDTDLRDLVLAYVRVEGSVIADRWGSPDLVDRLELCVAEGHALPHACTLWVDPSDRGLCIGYMDQGGTTVWVAARADQLKSLSAAWFARIAADP